MLVLLSFGLVLLATILLVVGLLSDDGITLIYLSIAASATAAVVLWLAFRRARPADDAPAGGPAPLEDELPEVVDDTGATAAPSRPTTPTPAVTPAPAPVAAAQPEPEPEPVPAAAAADEAWADDTDWEVDDLQFPIADYDDLSVAEIMPLLPQLYSDELDIVHERERTTKNRSTILARLEKLKETGTEADAEDEGAEVAATDERTEMPVADDPTQVIEAPTPAPARAPAPAPTPSVSLLDDEDEDDAAFFPIADYDDLSVSQIVPLLSQLELDELEDVKAREQAGANRSTLIAEIDRYLDGELEAFSWDEGEAAPAEAPASRPAPAAAPEPAADGARLPIAGYDDLNVADIRPLLTDLSDAELRTVLEHERARDNRKTIVSDIERRLDSAPAAPAPARAASRSTTQAATKTATKARKATKRATKKKAAKKAAKKSAASRFPIANYDDLTVAEIRPRLAKLTDAQLTQVRDRERAGAGRKTILDDIASRLG